MIRTYKTTARLSPFAHRELDRVLGLSVDLYNAALEERINAYKHSKKQISYIEQQNQFTLVRKDLQEYGSISSPLMRGVLKRLDNAYRRFFKHGGFPRFKSRRRYRTLEVYGIETHMLKDKELRIKGIPNLKLKSNIELPDSGQLKAIKIVKKPKRVEVHLGYELPNVDLREALNPVGIDLGVKNRMTLSTGETVEKRQADTSRTKRLQRSVSRKQNGSNNRRKAVQSLAKEHQTQAERNRGHLHELTAELIKKYDGFALEDLNVKGLLKNRNLARSISEQTWGLVTQMLLDKAESAGFMAVKVDPKYTSQDCSSCGNRVKKTLAQRIHHCEQCGLVLDRDHNAALNILTKGFGPGAGESPAVAKHWIAGVIGREPRAVSA